MSRIIEPEGWLRPSGYTSALGAKGEVLYVAGQIGCDKHRRMVSTDFVTQARKALSNIVEIIEAGGGRKEHIVRMTWYVTDVDLYRMSTRALGAAYRDVIGRHYPAMTLVEVSGLVDKKAKVEIEATAVIPEGS